MAKLTIDEALKGLARGAAKFGRSAAAKAVARWNGIAPKEQEPYGKGMGGSPGYGEAGVENEVPMRLQRKKEALEKAYELCGDEGIKALIDSVDRELSAMPAGDADGRQEKDSTTGGKSSAAMNSKCQACGHEDEAEWGGKCAGCGVENDAPVGYEQGQESTTAQRPEEKDYDFEDKTGAGMNVRANSAEEAWGVLANALGVPVEEAKKAATLKSSFNNARFPGSGTHKGCGGEFDVKSRNGSNSFDCLKCGEKDVWPSERSDPQFDRQDRQAAIRKWDSMSVAERKQWAQKARLGGTELDHQWSWYHQGVHDALLDTFENSFQKRGPSAATLKNADYHANTCQCGHQKDEHKLGSSGAGECTSCVGCAAYRHQGQRGNADDKKVCPNCDQWAYPSKSKGYYDCSSECAKRGFAPKAPMPKENAAGRECPSCGSANTKPWGSGDPSMKDSLVCQDCKRTFYDTDSGLAPERENADVQARGGEEAGKSGGTVTVVNAPDKCAVCEHSKALHEGEYGCEGPWRDNPTGCGCTKFEGGARKNSKGQTHAEFAKSKANPGCSAQSINFGGGCFTCGWEPKEYGGLTNADQSAMDEIDRLQKQILEEMGKDKAGDKEAFGRVKTLQAKVKELMDKAYKIKGLSNAGHLGPESWDAADLNERAAWLESAGLDIELARFPWAELSMDAHKQMGRVLDKPSSINNSTQADLDAFCMKLKGKKWADLPDDGPEQDHVAHEFEKAGGKLPVTNGGSEGDLEEIARHAEGIEHEVQELANAGTPCATCDHDKTLHQFEGNKLGKCRECPCKQYSKGVNDEKENAGTVHYTFGSGTEREAACGAAVSFGDKHAALKDVNCPKCLEDLSGKKQNSGPKKCQACDGTGVTLEEGEELQRYIDEHDGDTCDECNGTGKIKNAMENSMHSGVHRGASRYGSVQNDKLDKAIEQEYYRQASGVQINIMSIGKIYADCRAAVAAGKALESAMAEAVAKYRLN